MLITLIVLLAAVSVGCAVWVYLMTDRFEERLDAYSERADKLRSALQEVCDDPINAETIAELALARDNRHRQ